MKIYAELMGMKTIRSKDKKLYDNKLADLKSVAIRRVVSSTTRGTNLKQYKDKEEVVYVV